MGVMDKILNVMRLNPEEDYEYDNEDYEDEYEEERTGKAARKEKVYEDYDFDTKRKVKDKPAAKTNSKITPMRQSKKQGGEMEVCVIKPTSMDDAREITETLLLNRPVVLNVEGLDVEIAQRIIDFASGSCFAIDGNLQKISNYIFIITPACVDISGDFQDIMTAFDVASVQADF